MEQTIKKFEQKEDGIHYKEMVLEVKKDVRLSKEQYNDEKSRLMSKLEKVREQLDELHDEEYKLEKELELFTTFEEGEQIIVEEEIIEEKPIQIE